jgi:hypothetical protein
LEKGLHADTENLRKAQRQCDKLGRFALASDQEHIYQLGGIAFNIRRGQRYSHRFALYNPNEQKWQKLPSVSLGTGGAHMAMWPAKQSVVMISGIKKLGDRFSSRGITIGTYTIAQERWRTQVVRTRGLGTVLQRGAIGRKRYSNLTYWLLISENRWTQQEDLIVATA